MPSFELCRACSGEVLFPAVFVVFLLHKTAVQDHHLNVANYAIGASDLP